MSLLSLSVQVYGHPKIIAHIPANAFYPPPKVNSTILRIDRFPSPAIPFDELEVFFQLIKTGFSQKRKTLRNALAGGLHLSPPAVESMLRSAQIDPMRRAETLSLPEWHCLTQVFNAQFSPLSEFAHPHNQKNPAASSLSPALTNRDGCTPIKSAETGPRKNRRKCPGLTLDCGVPYAPDGHREVHGPSGG